MNQRQEVMIRDLLHNLKPHSTSGTQSEQAKYTCGILVATVGMIQAFEASFDFKRAIKIASDLAPQMVVAGCCPPTWAEDFGMTKPVGGYVSRDVKVHADNCEYRTDNTETLRSALLDFAVTIEAAGGLIRDDHDGDLCPVGDTSWTDLSDSYIKACQALNKEPMIAE